MCNHCVIESVKERMLNRRQLLVGGATGLAAVTAAGGISTPAVADSHSPISGAKLADMTHTISPEFPTYFGVPGFKHEQKFNFKEHGFNLHELTVNEHTGTHLDAPLHFSEDGQSVDEVPIENLVVPLVVIDIKAKAAENADAQVMPEDIVKWIATNGPLPEKCCVAMNSGWDAHVDSDKFRGVDADKKMHFPGFHVDATKMLLAESSAVGLAVDTLSLDYGLSADFATHYAWLPTNRWGLENLANLDRVPAKGATIMVGAPKHKGGTGGPARVFAIM